MLRTVILTGYLPQNYGRIAHLIRRGKAPVHVVFEGPMRESRRVMLLAWMESVLLWCEHSFFFRGHPTTSDDLYRRFGSLRALLQKHSIPWSQTENHNDASVESLLKNIQPDILILLGTRIIKPHILACPTMGTFNTHSSLLPKFRGARSEFWILSKQQPEYAGVTVHWVQPSLDTGDMCVQEHIPVAQNETPKSLRQKSHFLSPILLAETLRRLEEGEALRTPQDEIAATKFSKPTSVDEK